MSHKLSILLEGTTQIFMYVSIQNSLKWTIMINSITPPPLALAQNEFLRASKTPLNYKKEIWNDF